MKKKEKIDQNVSIILSLMIFYTFKQRKNENAQIDFKKN